jgi:hypothetical protein
VSTPGPPPPRSPGRPDEVNGLYLLEVAMLHAKVEHMVDPHADVCPL